MEGAMRRRHIDKLLVADDLDKAFAEIKRENDALKKHPWVADLIRVLSPHRCGLQRRLVMEHMRSLRGPTVLNSPKEFENTAQSAFQRHCSQSDTFTLGPEDDLFYWPKGKGAGVWAVHKERASAWLRARGVPDI